MSDDDPARLLDRLAEPWDVPTPENVLTPDEI
jgi:hypothetical protein